MKKKFGCSVDIAVVNYKKYLMLTENSRYNKLKKEPNNKFTKSLINYWIRRVLVDLKRSGAQVFIIEFHEDIEYFYGYKFF